MGAAVRFIYNVAVTLTHILYNEYLKEERSCNSLERPSSFLRRLTPPCVWTWGPDASSRYCHRTPWRTHPSCWGPHPEFSRELPSLSALSTPRPPSPASSSSAIPLRTLPAPLRCSPGRSLPLSGEEDSSRGCWRRVCSSLRMYSQIFL